MSPELEAAFPVLARDSAPTLPEIAPLGEPAEHRFGFTVWHTWMDPNGHVNHPAYVDWGDEALCRIAAAAGLDPTLVEPVGERLQYRQGARGGDGIEIVTQLAGTTGTGDLAVRQRMADAAGSRGFVEATLVRRYVGEGGNAALARALMQKD
jgi:acyl-CoA thioesterase FadM